VKGHSEGIRVKKHTPEHPERPKGKMEVGTTSFGQGKEISGGKGGRGEVPGDQHESGKNERSQCKRFTGFGGRSDTRESRREWATRSVFRGGGTRGAKNKKTNRDPGN